MQAFVAGTGLPSLWPIGESAWCRIRLQQSSGKKMDKGNDVDDVSNNPDSDVGVTWVQLRSSYNEGYITELILLCTPFPAT